MSSGDGLVAEVLNDDENVTQLRDADGVVRSVVEGRLYFFFCSDQVRASRLTCWRIFLLMRDVFGGRSVSITGRHHYIVTADPPPSVLTPLKVKVLNLQSGRAVGAMMIEVLAVFSITVFERRVSRPRSWCSVLFHAGVMCV